jgi:hypothetical protein
MKKSKRRWWLIAIFVVPVALVTTFVIWARLVPEPMPEALRALQSDDMVAVDATHWIVFRPTGQTPTVGFIFYPGGRVDFRSYAPAARAIASDGYLVVMVPMPLNLAVLAPDRALEVQKAFPNVRQWVIGGHSLGGAMAARFAYKHPETVQGLVLWAAYPPGSDNRSNSTIAVVSISGTLDGLATPEKNSSIPHLAAFNNALGGAGKGESCPVWLVWSPKRRQAGNPEPHRTAGTDCRRYA